MVMTSSTVQVYHPSPLHGSQDNDTWDVDRWVTDVNVSLTSSPQPSVPPGGAPPLSKETHQFQNAVRLIHVYYTPVLFAVGSLGNAFSVLILARLPIRNQSTSNYLMAVCIAETLFLAYSFYFWLTDFDVSLYHIGGWCQFITLVRHVTDFLAVWFMVSYTTDRYIAWCCPKHRSSCCTTIRAKLVIVSTTIVAVVVYVNISIMFGLLDMGSKAFCHPLHEFSKVYEKLRLADVIFNSLLPFCVILTLFIFTLAARLRDRNKSVCASGRAVPGEDPESPSSAAHAVPQTGVWLTYHVAYFMFMCPEEALRLYDVTESYALGRPILLHQFLWESLFLLVKQTKYALNLALLLLAYPAFRHATCTWLVQALCWVCRRRVRLSACHNGIKEETVGFNKAGEGSH